MEKGLITSDMVNEAFKQATTEGGRFYGMTKRMGESPMGKWSTFVDALRNSLLKVYDILRPLVIPTMNLLTFIVDGLQKSIQYLIYRFQRWGELLNEGNTLMIAITGVIIGVSSVMARQVAWTGLLALWQGYLFVKTTLVTGAQWLWNIALGANPIGLIIVGIAALIALIYVIIKKYNDWGAALTLVLGPIGLLINAIMSFKRNWDSVVKAFKDDGIIGGIKRIGIVLLDAILYPVQQLLQLLSKIPGLEKLAGGGADKILEIRNKLGLITTEKTIQDKIAPAKQPGIAAIVKGAGSADYGSGSGNKNNEGISAGGSRNTAIHINFKNMVESIVFDGTLADKRGDLEKEVISIMARVLGMAQATA